MESTSDGIRAINSSTDVVSIPTSVSFAENLPTRHSNSADSLKASTVLVKEKKWKCCGLRSHKRKGCQPSSEFARHTLAFCLLCLWLVGGMWVFYMVEYPAEQRRIAEQTTPATPTTTTTEAPIIVLNLTGLNPIEATLLVLSQFAKDNYEIVEVNNYTNEVFVKVKENSTLGTIQNIDLKDSCQSNTTLLPKWDLTGSIFFCITVVTTIGYGNYAPSTETGRLICVIFAIVGIPLTLIVVSNMGKLLTRFADRIAQCTTRCIKTLRRHPSLSNLQQHGAEEDMQQIAKRRKIERRQRRFAALISTLIISLLGVVIFLLLPSILFSNWEEWDYVTSLYYSFITLSTIGFGDYVAGQSQSPDGSYELYRLFLSIWIFFGMAFIATFISSVQTLLDKLTKDSVTRIQTRISQSKLAIKLSRSGSLAPSQTNQYLDQQGKSVSMPSTITEEQDDNVATTSLAALAHRLSTSMKSNEEIVRNNNSASGLDLAIDNNNNINHNRHSSSSSHLESTSTDDESDDEMSSSDDDKEDEVDFDQLERL